jgi:hypothetical protein
VWFCEILVEEWVLDGFILGINWQGLSVKGVSARKCRMSSRLILVESYFRLFGANVDGRLMVLIRFASALQRSSPQIRTRHVHQEKQVEEGDARKKQKKEALEAYADLSQFKSNITTV